MRVWTGERYNEGDEYPEYNCAEWSPAECTNGVVKSVNETCAGKCNYHPEDVARHVSVDYRSWQLTSRSYVAACSNKTICVKEGGKYNRKWEKWEDKWDKRDKWDEDAKWEYKYTICTGNSRCQGELQWCQSKERKTEKCPDGFKRCPGIGSNNKGINRTKSVFGQCIEYEKMRDGNENNCVDRSDEDTGWQKLLETAKGLRQKVWTESKNCKP